jgi:hypothetical protein
LLVVLLPLPYLLVVLLPLPYLLVVLLPLSYPLVVHSPGPLNIMIRTLTYGSKIFTKY